jgi:transforming growth factor-beta-induced protein
MKNLLNNYKLLILLFVGLMTISCSDDDDTPVSNPELGTIVEIAIDTPDLSNLVAALGAADGDLVTTLSGGEFTVLAPTNAAFETFLSENGFATLGDVPTDVLANILLNHVISGSVSSSDLATLGAGYSTTNAINADGDNLSIYFDTSDGVVFNGISSVAAADVTASNGIVHVVDAVIGLPTVVTFATADPTFETLVAALTREDHQEDFVSILSSSDEPAPLTVFAPTNAAFGDLLSFLGYSTLAEIDLGLLENVLGMHVVPEANVRSGDLTEGMEAVTVADETITFSLTTAPNITDPNGFVSNIIVVDVQAMNGVVHAVDKVILPVLD